MGNAATRTMVTEKMCRERDIGVEKAMNEMTLNPVIATFEPEWCAENLFQHPVWETLMNQSDIWGLEVGYNTEKQPQRAFLKQMKQHIKDMTRDSWYHIVVKMGANYWIPRFRTNILEDTFVYDLAKRLPYIKVMCAYDASLPIPCDISELWVYPTFMKHSIYLLMTPHQHNNVNQFNFLHNGNGCFLYLSEGEDVERIHRTMAELLDNQPLMPRTIPQVLDAPSTYIEADNTQTEPCCRKRDTPDTVLEECKSKHR